MKIACLKDLSENALKYQKRKVEMNYSLSFLSMQVKQQHQSEQHYESSITQMNHQQNSTTTVNGQYQVSAILVLKNVRQSDVYGCLQFLQNGNVQKEIILQNFPIQIT